MAILYQHDFMFSPQHLCLSLVNAALYQPDIFHDKTFDDIPPEAHVVTGKITGAYVKGDTLYGDDITLEVPSTAGGGELLAVLWSDVRALGLLPLIACYGGDAGNRLFPIPGGSVTFVWDIGRIASSENWAKA